LFAGALWLVATSATAAEPPQGPEAASGRTQKSALAGRRQMVVAAHPLASEAGLAVLNQGGNALDAALAAQWMLNLVEPQSSGIGGGAFLLYWDAKAKQLTAWDGRETAPQAANENFARKPDGSLMGFMELVASGRSVGTPGLVAMLSAAHTRHGALPWAASFAPAIERAEKGFTVSPRLATLIAKDSLLPRNPEAAALYLPEGQPLAVGMHFRNPALAASLREIAAQGPRAFYSGSRAERLVKAVGAQGGALAVADLAAYRPKTRDAVCAGYRGYKICSMPPPSSGGVTLLQLLGILERSGPTLTPPDATAHLHRFAEAGRLAYADRNRYLADPDFVAVPQAAMLNPAYLQARAALIRADSSLGRAAPGELPKAAAAACADSLEVPATTHLSIVDSEGNVAALTSSVESAFGSRILVDGFLLNNHLTDFSWVAENEGKPAANRLEPGKRPLSSMAPTIVFDRDGEVWAVLGSPGGPAIINFVASVLVGLIDGGLDPQAAVSRPHLGSRNGVTDVEAGPQAEARVGALQALGHGTRIFDFPSGTHLIVRSPDGKGWIGAADPRREGEPRGD
jgi:gamma-glutamyltranspeptidase/glutathione hydrolase